MKKILTIALALLMVLALAACSSTAPQESEAPKESQAAESKAPDTADPEPGEEETPAEPGGEALTIGFSTKTITNNEFQRIMVVGAQNYVEAAGHTFELTLAGGEQEVSIQNNNVEDLINKGVDGIIVIPMDGEAIIPALQKAQDANIPVVIGDSSVAEGNEELYITYIGTDNYKVGQEAASQMIEAVGEGEALLVTGVSGSVSSEMRSNGFKDGLEGSSVTLANEQSGEWSSEVAMQVTENMLTSNPDAKGIFLCSDGMLPGVLSAVENAGKTGQITVISVDGNRSAVEQIEEGNCYGTVGQYPEKIGAMCAEYLINAIQGNLDVNSVEKFIDTGFLFMSANNLEESYEYSY
ncbi:MAG: sugar ABC transporter substrate-binding protein [Christensenellales bacterium]